MTLLTSEAPVRIGGDTGETGGILDFAVKPGERPGKIAGRRGARIDRARLALAILLSSVLAASPLPAPAASGDKGTQELVPALKVRVWSQENKAPRGIVIAVHGTTQHAASLARMAESLSECGFQVLAFDLRGHGARFHGAASDESSCVVNYRSSADDLIALCRAVRSENRGIPVFCLGESVGSAVVIRAASRDAHLCDGIILCAAGTRPRFYNPLMVIPDFCKGIVRLDHPMDVTRYITRYSSDDERVCREMIGDPLSRVTLTPREILRTAGFIHSAQKNARHIPETISLLIIQGEIDGIVSRGSVESMFKKLKSRDKQLLVFEDCGHVLLGTTFIKAPVLDSLKTWLIKRSDPGDDTVVSLSKRSHTLHN